MKAEMKCLLLDRDVHYFTFSRRSGRKMICLQNDASSVHRYLKCLSSSSNPSIKTC